MTTQPIQYHTMNKKIKKITWSDDDKRYLLNNAKKLTLSDIAKNLGRKEISVINMSTKLGCGYKS